MRLRTLDLNKPLYKVLQKESNYWGASRYRLTGGYTSFDYTPFLPRFGKPGKPLPNREPLNLCISGWHLTSDPFAYGARSKSARVFVAVPEFQVGAISWSKYSNKIAFKSIRLLYEVVWYKNKWVKKTLVSKRKRS